jgi:formylglycine-generating enzyme required for sulfatase activity
MICRAILFCVALFAAGPSLAAETFRDCAECPEMIVIPPGTFKMGSSQAELSNNEGPQHTVTIRKPFAVGIYNVTYDQWDACVADGSCDGYMPSDQGWGRGNRPVVAVNWSDAQVYVRWLNEKVRSSVTTDAAASAPTKPGPYRLLSEAEWEYAARGGTTTAYYWGDAHRKGYANCDRCGSEWDNTQTAPVGSFPPNPFGLYDMAGNVLQWTQDCFHENYTGAPTDGSAWVTGPVGACSMRMMRGGSWFNSTYYLRVTQRYIVSPHIRANNAGFRVAKTLD